MEPVTVAVIAAYLIAVTTLGALLVRRTATARDWTVAGGRMGAAMLVAGIAGTRIGGGATYGVAGEVVSGGVWHLWWYALATFLALALVGWLFAVPYRRLGLQTVGEAFWRRDRSRRCQAFTSLCVQAEYFVVIVIEVYLIAAILRSATGLSMWLAALVAAFVLVSYTTLGGLWGAAATNLVHSGVMLVGLAIVAWLGLERLGGWAALTASVGARLADAGRDPRAWWSPLGAGLAPAVAMVFSAAIHTPAASIYANFSSAAREEHLLRPAFLAAGALAALMPLLAGLVGIETLARYGLDTGLSGYANITALASEMNPWIGGLALAAILAALISSGGPVLLSSATMFVRDWLPRRSGEAGRLRAYRTTTVAFGLVAALVAWLVSLTAISLLDLLLLGYAMVVPPAIAVGYALYWRGATEAGLFWGMAAGFAGGLVCYPLSLHGAAPDPSYATTLIPLVAVPLVSQGTRAGSAGNAAFYEALEGPA